MNVYSKIRKLFTEEIIFDHHDNNNNNNNRHDDDDDDRQLKNNKKRSIKKKNNNVFIVNPDKKQKKDVFDSKRLIDFNIKAYNLIHNNKFFHTAILMVGIERYFLDELESGDTRKNNNNKNNKTPTRESFAI